MSKTHKTKNTPAMMSVQRARNIANGLLEDALFLGLVESDNECCEFLDDYDARVLNTFVEAFNQELNDYEEHIKLKKSRKENSV